MKTLNIHATIFMMLAAISFHSCVIEESDGKWDPMEWKSEVKVKKTRDGVYSVPADGVELTFSCQNYSPWIDYAKSNGEKENYYYADDYHTITADWFKVEISGNKLRVVFEANDTEEERVLILGLTAGDIFDSFKFKQFAKQ